LTSGRDDLILVTTRGKALRIKESAIRAMGRTAHGVRGIRLYPDDWITSMEVVQPEAFLLIVTEKGYGKRVDLTQYRTQGRGAHGVATLKSQALESVGLIATARVVKAEDDITIITTNGVMLRLSVKGIRTQGRATRGIKLMNVEKGDKVSTLARISNIEPEVKGKDEKPVLPSEEQEKLFDLVEKEELENNEEEKEEDEENEEDEEEDESEEPDEGNGEESNGEEE
jgi:DNA gyrase subunit A